METDIQTQQQAQIIAHDYGFWPVEPLMCERTISETTIRTLFFANVPNTIKCLIKYDRDELADWR